jgi:hypothetical protein
MKSACWNVAQILRKAMNQSENNGKIRASGSYAQPCPQNSWTGFLLPVGEYDCNGLMESHP